MLLSPQASRLSIFAFYDKDGIVDDYIPHLLSAMLPFCREQVVVVNGPLTAQGEEKLRTCSTKILRRPNVGYDISGYRDGLLQTPDLSLYDEVLFFNQTVFGPFCPLSRMFDDMGRRDLDFWGLTRHPAEKKTPWSADEPLPLHLQSYFFAVRRPMLESEAFLSYWTNLPKIETYWDAVSKHEIVFTRYFEELGYKWEAYINTTDLEPFNHFPIMGMPAEALRRGSPFIKRKVFTASPQYYTTSPQGGALDELYPLIKKSGYPLSLISQNVLRTTDIKALTTALQPYCLLPADGTPDGTVAAVLWFAQKDLADILLDTAEKLARRCTLFCLFATKDLADAFSPRLPRGTQTEVPAGHGLDCIFTMLWPRLSGFDYVMYLNNALPAVLDYLADYSTLKNGIACLDPARCAALLNDCPAIGLLVPAPPIHQESLSDGLNWPAVRPAIAPLLEKIGFRSPLAEKSSVAVRGNFFFARTAAVAPLSRLEWADGLFDRAYPGAEYLLPLAAQSAGLLTGYACTPGVLKMQVRNRDLFVNAVLERFATPRKRRIDEVLYRMDGILHFYDTTHNEMTLKQAFTEKLTLKQKLWICLQVMLKPETFAKLHKASPVTYPDDPLA